MLKISIVFMLLTATISSGQSKAINKNEADKTSQWSGKRVGYLGDSMTQKRDSNVTVYWEFLEETMGIHPYVYGISGHQWTGIYAQAQRLKKEHANDVDAIFIFAGTNDYNHNTPIGKFYNEGIKRTNFNGKMVERKYRTLLKNDSTFCGRINKVLSYLKSNFPDQQIIILTPIHRGFAQFNAKNVQPEERFANGLGLYLDTYVNTLKEAASIWSVPFIDLYTLSGLYPLKDQHAKYFLNAETDRLHPNSEGNFRLAETIKYQLLALPATFNVE